MPPDTQADGPGGQKARRTRGPASPGQRTAQPFGGDAECVPPALCAGDIGLPRAFGGPPYTRGLGPRGHSAGLPQAAARRGHRFSQAFRSLPQAAATPGASVFAGSRGPPAGRRHARDIGLPQAFRGPRRSPHARGIGLPQAFRGLPPHTGHRPPAGVPRPTQAAATRGASVLAGPRRRSAASRRPRGASPPAARRPPSPPPAARFSRKPPCGIGPRMVYCT